MLVHIPIFIDSFEATATAKFSSCEENTKQNETKTNKKQRSLNLLFDSDS